MKAKKYLGQNFLTSPKFIGDVIRASGITENDTVVEIGPGKGAITEALLETAKQVIAIETDENLIPILEEKFKTHIDEKRFILVHGDALAVDIATYTDKPYSVVANIPYYITGQILRTFLGNIIQPTTMTLIVQNEVADRIVCRDGKESVLSLSVKAYGNPRKIEKIPARYFKPTPKVDSAILYIDNISRNFFDSISEDEFFELIKTGFEHKRKRLAKNLEMLYSKETIQELFSRCNVSKNSRAEELSRELWKCLLLHK